MSLRGIRMDRTWSVVALAIVVGLALRIAAARGGLWLDEAWSAVYAAQARTPLGVFIAINHDNNHHLNSLWLQAIGLSAPAWLARLPSILAGTGAIAVAAMIGARRSPATAMITAWLFAISPILVDLGSQARGYATMVLALLGMILLLDRWLDDPAARPPRLALGALALLGMLSQLTMLFGIVALGGWVLIRLTLRDGVAPAIGRTTDAMLPAFAAALVMIAIVFGAAGASGKGLSVGDYVTYSTTGQIEGLQTLVLDTFGVALSSPGATVAIALGSLLAMAAVPALRPRAPFWLLAILALPLTIALLSVPNAQYSRYYLVAGIAGLLLLADWSGLLLSGKRAAPRAAVSALLVALIFTSLFRDIRMIEMDRGDPAAPIEFMRTAAPGGTDILIDSQQPWAVLRAAAATAHYSLRIRRNCPAAAFLLVQGRHVTPFPARTTRCGADYTLVRASYVGNLTGIDWALYRDDTGKD